MSDWISVYDHLPKPRQLVAVLVERFARDADGKLTGRLLKPTARIAYHTGGGTNGIWKEHLDPSAVVWDVTHWAPIPSLPRRGAPEGNHPGDAG